MQGIVSHAQAPGVQSMLIMNLNYTSTPSLNGISMDAIFAAAKSLAQANNYDYYGVTSLPRFASVAAAAAAGFYNSNDQIHLSDAGQTALWNGLNGFLTTTLYNWYPVNLGAAAGPQ